MNEVTYEHDRVAALEAGPLLLDSRLERFDLRCELLDLGTDLHRLLVLLFRVVCTILALLVFFV